MKRAAEGFIPPHGGYERLRGYQKALVIFDGTKLFCKRFLKRGDRTRDQMVQAARSGKQNILEGSEASGTSKETEIKLTGVAKASLKELLEELPGLPPQRKPPSLGQEQSRSVVRPPARREARFVL